MAENNRTDENANANIEGEGSYTGALDYRQSVQGFMRTKRGRIDDLAREAEEALDGPEGQELRRAEAEGEADNRGDRAAGRA